jgi:hypothetical protein
MTPTPTRSPTWRVVTSEPVSATMPAISWPGTMGKQALAPVAVDLVDVTVADAGVVDLYLYVVGAEVPALDGGTGERFSGGCGGVGGDGGSHGHLLSDGAAWRCDCAGAVS